ncbi:MAG: LPS export ABC transporter periplasmic protein LptC [Sulfurovum sp.]|nr:LPS export ABC transporter periplasmic protein LptC [Sulfurovum sp.]
MKLSNTLNKNKVFTKDLEFTDTTFIEVDTQKMQGWAFSTYGMHNKGILTLDNIVFHTDNIDSLVAKKGKFIKDVLYLDGDVLMHEKDGYTYKTQHANYNQKTEILNITAPFTSTRGQNIMHGKTLSYDTVNKKVFGVEINAILYTTKK